MKKGRTLDRGPPGAKRAPIYTVGVIGPKRKLRPDGSLLCEDVPIARTGTMLYRPGEIPLKPPTRPGAAQVLYVTRDRDTLFAPCSLGSVIGAAITLDHPPVDVNPTNWPTLARGFVLDAWQGEGDEEGELMFADLVITDRGLIHKVNTEGPGALREVSLGYSAEYEQTGDGEGRQHNIVINHLALVDRGRCGPRCAIGDRQPEEIHMARENGTNGGPRPRVRLNDTLAAVRQQLDELEEQHAEGDDDSTHIHVHVGDGRTEDNDDGGGGRSTRRTLDAETEERFSNIEEGMLELASTQTSAMTLLAAIAEKVGVATTATKEGATKDGDSAALHTSFMQFTSQAEILIPGFKPPTFDSALPRAKTVDAMCAGRRQVLTLLAAQASGKALLDQVTEGEFDIATAPCPDVAIAFKAAAAVKAASNNRSVTGDRMGLPAPMAATQGVVGGGGMKRVSDADINAANAKYWAEQHKSA
jgi:uncharacterized protein